jgi:hypothetical protein
MALSRICRGAGAASASGRPGEAYGGIVLAKQKDAVPAYGGRMQQTFGHGLVTPSHPAAAGGKLFLHLENAASNVAGPARHLRGGGACPYSSQRLNLGNQAVTEYQSSPESTPPNVPWTGQALCHN